MSIGLIAEEETIDIPPIMPPSYSLEGNYIGLIQCKTLYEMYFFTLYRLIAGGGDNPKTFLESEELKMMCDIDDRDKIRCGYIEKFT